MEMVIHTFMLVLFTDSPPTFAQVTRDVLLHTLEFVVDLVVEHQQKLCTQPINATFIVCEWGRSPWFWVMAQVLVWRSEGVGDHGSERRSNSSYKICCLSLNIFPAEILQHTKNWGFWCVFKNKCDLTIYLWKKNGKGFAKLLGFRSLEQLLLFYVNNFRLPVCSFHLLKRLRLFLR